MGRTISQRELRNDISRVLREVEGGESVQVTVAGRPVVEIRPLSARRGRVPMREVIAFLATVEPDPTLADDIRFLDDETTDSL
jgi:prevent-host-death family protein